MTWLLMNLFKPKNLNHYLEPKDLQLVEFEPVNKHLTHGSIKGINVLVHYYHDVLVEDNNAIVHKDQNDAFIEAFINVYILELCNPKGHVYSQP